MSFLPKIAAFLCWKWGYGAADMAGTIRSQYPASFRAIRVPCTGRISTDLILRALRKGADAVVIVGWYEGECEYETGNLLAMTNVKYLKQMLDLMGVGADRVQMHFCTAAEGAKFAEVVKEVTAQIVKLGPSPLKLKLPAEEEWSS